MHEAFVEVPLFVEILPRKIPGWAPATFNLTFHPNFHPMSWFLQIYQFTEN